METRTQKPKGLDAALEYWFVLDPGMWDNDTGPKGWWAVGNEEESITAYFGCQVDAYRHRLAMINRDLNP